MTVEVTLIMTLLLGLVLYGLVALCLGHEGRRIVETCTRRPEPPGDEDVLFAPHGYRQRKSVRPSMSKRE